MGAFSSGMSSKEKVGRVKKFRNYAAQRPHERGQRAEFSNVRIRQLAGLRCERQPRENLGSEKWKVHPHFKNSTSSDQRSRALPRRLMGCLRLS